MSFVAVAVGGSALVGAGTSLYLGGQAQDSADAAAFARQQAIKKYQDSYEKTKGEAVNGTYLGQYGLGDIYGTKADAVEYNPVSFDSSLMSSVLGNSAASGATSDLTSRTNAINVNDANSRINTLLPGYGGDLSSYQGATKSLLDGQLPFSDVLDIVSNRGELNNALGTPGAGTNATLKDLGISRLQATQQGGSMFQSILGSLNQNVSPTGNLFTAQSNYLTPGARLSGDLEQAQLQQQSGQSAAFLAASADPAAAGSFNNDLAVNSAAAGMNAGAAAATNTNAGAPYYAQAANTLAGLIPSLVGGIAGSGFGGGNINPSGYGISARPTAAQLASYY